MALIDKDDLLTKFDTGALLFQPEVKRIIKIQPEVDAVPVVRCKDCIYNPQICFIGCPVDVPVDDDFF